MDGPLPLPTVDEVVFDAATDGKQRDTGLCRLGKIAPDALPFRALSLS